MRFIRKNGRIIPIRETGVQKGANVVAKAAAFASGAGAGHALGHLVKAVGALGSGKTALADAHLSRSIKGNIFAIGGLAAFAAAKLVRDRGQPKAVTKSKRSGDETANISGVIAGAVAAFLPRKIGAGLSGAGSKTAGFVSKGLRKQRVARGGHLKLVLPHRDS